MVGFTERKVSMDWIKTINISSRRSEKIGDGYFTFEMTLGADVDGMSAKEKKDYMKKLWDLAGEEVDNQISETIKSIQK